MHQDPELTQLRAQKRETEHLLAALEEFEKRWDEFASMLEHVVKLCSESGLAIWSAGVVEAALRKADALRIDVASRQQEVLPAYRDPLAKFLRTSGCARLARLNHSELVKLRIGPARRPEQRRIVPLAGLELR